MMSQRDSRKENDMKLTVNRYGEQVALHKDMLGDLADNTIIRFPASKESCLCHVEDVYGIVAYDPQNNVKYIVLLNCYGRVETCDELLIDLPHAEIVGVATDIEITVKDS